MKSLRASGGRSTALRYGTAVGCVAWALLMRMAIDPYLHNQLPYVTFFVAVTVTAWFGGLGPALLSTALGFLAAEWFFVGPAHASWTAISMVNAVAYFLVTLPIAVFSHTLHKAREQAVARQEELEREIGERSKAEEELRNAYAKLGRQTADLTAAMQAQELDKRRFEEVLSHLPVCVALLTPDHHVAFANRMFRERFGESQGRRCFEYIFRRAAPCEFCQTYRVLETMEPNQWECAGLDGSIYQVFDFPFTDADGSTRILEVNVDITESKRAEEELRVNRQRLALALKAGHAGSFDWDIINDVDVWSPEIEELYGVAPGEFGGRYESWEALVLPEDLEIARAAIQESLRTGEFQSEWRVRRPNDGQVRWLAARATVLFDEGGRPSRMVGINVDVTDRKRAEESLQTANRQLRQLSSDLLRSQDYERRRIARELHDSTAQLLATLSLTLSRLKEPGLEPDRRERLLSEAIDLAAACSMEIRTVTYLLHPPLLDEVGLTAALQGYAQGFNQRTGIQVEIKIPPDFGRLSSEMETTLFRIVQEGLANVHKHSGSRSAVIRLERDATEVRLVLKDRGHGLPWGLDTQDKGFVRFGVGILGMRERAEQLGGRLELASKDGGTRLTVTVPLVQSDEKTADIVGG